MSRFPRQAIRESSETPEAVRGDSPAASGTPRNPYGRATRRTPRGFGSVEPRDAAVRRFLEAERYHREPLPAAHREVYFRLAAITPTGQSAVVASVIGLANATGRTCETVAAALGQLADRGYLRRTPKRSGEGEDPTSRIRWSFPDGRP